VDTTLALARRLVALLRREEITFLAAAVAYYAFVSLVPALLLVFAIASFVGGDSMAETALDATSDVLSPVGQGLLADALAGATGRGPATFVSLALLVWSTLKVFRGLDVAFSRVYGVEPAASFFGRMRDAAIALGGVGTGLAALVLVNAVVTFSGVVFAGVAGTVLLVALLSVVLFPLYYLFPDATDPAIRALPGAVVAAGGWTLLGTVFRVYAGLAGTFDLYGVLGGVLLLVTWYYVGSMVLLVGAAVNAVLAGRADETGTDKNPPADNPHDNSV
jgi:YihY family inner membrane protein